MTRLRRGPACTVEVRPAACTFTLADVWTPGDPARQPRGDPRCDVVSSSSQTRCSSRVARASARQGRRRIPGFRWRRDPHDAVTRCMRSSRQSRLSACGRPEARMSLRQRAVEAAAQCRRRGRVQAPKSASDDGGGSESRAPGTKRSSASDALRCPEAGGNPRNRIQNRGSLRLEPNVRIELTAYALPRRASRRPPIPYSLVVSGAVSAQPTRFRVPLSNRACGSPAHGSPMVV